MSRSFFAVFGWRYQVVMIISFVSLSHSRDNSFFSRCSRVSSSSCIATMLLSASISAVLTVSWCSLIMRRCNSCWLSSCCWRTSRNCWDNLLSAVIMLCSLSAAFDTKVSISWRNLRLPASTVSKRSLICGTNKAWICTSQDALLNTQESYQETRNVLDIHSNLGQCNVKFNRPEPFRQKHSGKWTHLISSCAWIHPNSVNHYIRMHGFDQ